MIYADDLNSLQDATLASISATRDAIQARFSAHHSPEDPVDSTLRRLFAFLSDRSQAVSFLVSAGYVWDAEIILRSFYEANARIWFICLTSSDDRPALVEEFWGENAAIHNRKRAGRASAAVNTSRKYGNSGDEAVFAALMREDIFGFDEGNKQARKAIEQKWSFSEIVRFLEKNAPPDFDMGDIPALLHMYGQASHLIHADESALDLMLDRKMRAPEELEILSCAHVCRIFNDQASMWILSAMALEYRHGRDVLRDPNVAEKFAAVQGLTKPFTERFNASQAEFYSRWSNR
jgi:hypothetical protein